ncbi:MAG: type II toxin-antitoxin system VapC family toxin [Boseongicola sp. SB0676_bin_33]|uniref:Ribonuclease VapC n=1 Tax=Boseongicola sp. SB0664_bin_43 TaxID=2604844 RepID=A0A6B0XZ92_9RHOB|nr:type II toxin-antitoxin system VapC family toxin [Boseongicola sp. SB0664_bin_43]MYF88397.1 type II toxin-antitoxin system VapC family toxin [Boseongicola sp. SB0676_bin_33]MYK32332.1 type II toxin-antitoxin system VapC family toxin [Boseongicola sp. SB0670_bin_30]
MIIDSSALLAILNREPDAARYEEAILTAATCGMSVANVLETSIVVESRGGVQAGHELTAFLEVAEIRPAPVTAEHLEAARLAWRRFGKGRHPAALNFGDCFAYALARVTSEPLLYKGNDFALTDILAAMPPAHGPAGSSC